MLLSGCGNQCPSSPQYLVAFSKSYMINEPLYCCVITSVLHLKERSSFEGANVFKRVWILLTSRFEVRQIFRADLRRVRSCWRVVPAQPTVPVTTTVQAWRPTITTKGKYLQSSCLGRYKCKIKRFILGGNIVMWFTRQHVYLIHYEVDRFSFSQGICSHFQE